MKKYLLMTLLLVWGCSQGLGNNKQTSRPDNKRSKVYQESLKQKNPDDNQIVVKWKLTVTPDGFKTHTQSFPFVGDEYKQNSFWKRHIIISTFKENYLDQYRGTSSTLLPMGNKIRKELNFKFGYNNYIKDREKFIANKRTWFLLFFLKPMANSELTGPIFRKTIILFSEDVPITEHAEYTVIIYKSGRVERSKKDLGEYKKIIDKDDNEIL